jgi:iron uptake system component EfeO
MNRLLTAGATAVLAFVPAACSEKAPAGDAISVVSTQTECRVAQTQLPSGKHSFRVDNQGAEVTEVYVYAPGDKVVSEKEHIGPGTQVSFSASLKPGDYEIACKPGERGTGIRQKITVT